MRAIAPPPLLLQQHPRSSEMLLDVQATVVRATSSGARGHRRWHERC
jgi:hypothetical protein